MNSINVIRVFILSCFISSSSLALAQQPPAPPKPSKEQIRKIKMQFEREPSVRAVQKAALRFFKVNPERVAGYRSGAAWKAIVPDLEVTFNHEQGVNDRRLSDAMYSQSSLVQQNPYNGAREIEDNTRKSYSVGVRAHWALDRLIFNAEVLDVTSLVGVQEGLLREITSLYYTRRRLIVMGALNPPQDEGEKITEDIRLSEIEGNLDALTGGYLSREIKKRKENRQRRRRRK